MQLRGNVESNWMKHIKNDSAIFSSELEAAFSRRQYNFYRREHTVEYDSKKTFDNPELDVDQNDRLIPENF